MTQRCIHGFAPVVTKNHAVMSGIYTVPEVCPRLSFGPIWQLWGFHKSTIFLLVLKLRSITLINHPEHKVFTSWFKSCKRSCCFQAPHGIKPGPSPKLSGFGIFKGLVAPATLFIYFYINRADIQYFIYTTRRVPLHLLSSLLSAR